MLNRKECEEACLYLLAHCYETDAPALENGEKGKVYKFTPSGFKESEIFKQLIEEHFELKEKYSKLQKVLDNQPLEFEDLKERMWVWDNKYKHYIKIRRVKRKNSFIGYYPNFEINPFTDEKCDNLQSIFFFEENRFYLREVKDNVD